MLLLWHLAGRWGRVQPSGLRLLLPLTHRMLGQLVGAERPSISHALARLSHAEIVTGSTPEPAAATPETSEKSADAPDK